MSKSTAPGPNNGYSSGTYSEPVDISIAPLKWDDEFSILNSPVGETVYQDLTAPLDQPSTRRFAYRKVANLFKGVDISPLARPADLEGRQILVELRETWKETSTTDEDYAKYGPARATLSVSYPAGMTVDVDDIAEMVGRLLNGMCGDPAVAEIDVLHAGLDTLMRGVTRRG